MRRTKKVIYAEYGIEYKSGKIFCEPLNSWISPLLINGNKKIGRGVWQWSMTAGNKNVSDEVAARVVENITTDMDANTVRIMCGGTCNLNCPGCYAQTGCYVFFSTRLSLARKTFLVRMYMEWVERAINAQIDADKILYCRIHVAGDFISNDYVEMWARICKAHPETCFWTYTKQTFSALATLDGLQNCNIVKSLVDGKVNYGKAGYIIALYKDLVARGENVYICRCGIDSNQHCAGCHHCFTSKYVLFLEHSTSYKPENDPDYSTFIELVNSQIEKAA